MKNTVLNILSNYLELFPKEQKRQLIFKNYVETHNDIEIIDWNNFNGHIVTGGFIYAKEENKFLVLHHKDLNIDIYPGGHIDGTDKNPLEAAIREVHEETGIYDLTQLKICKNKLVPIDIDTHKVPYNKRLNLPEHYHFDFRYLFVIDKIEEVKIDEEEANNYKWVDIIEFKNDINYRNVIDKIEKILSNESIKNKTLLK